MAATAASVDTQHEDTIHDVQFDYSGKRLATCSSDSTIRIFDSEPGHPPIKVAELRGHTGPVWRVSWAHPRFGVVLASCSYDKRVIIWKETQPNSWDILYEYTGLTKSVMCVAWAPVEHGLELACASSDGSLAVLTYEKGTTDRNTWRETKIPKAHPGGAMCVSWGPAFPPGSLISGTEPSPTSAAAPAISPQKQFVSGGCDNSVKIWVFSDKAHTGTPTWECAQKLEMHTDWVRDVAWADTLGPISTIASCSTDGVIVWGQDRPGTDSALWKPQETLNKFGEPVWHVSWNPTGTLLAVSSGTNKVSLWKETLDHKWKRVDNLDEQQSSS
ncbi:SEC13 protein [Pelomyxa schiedti]|nr:SEC13 protein [Pelomyxa schiedti]